MAESAICAGACARVLPISAFGLTRSDSAVLGPAAGPAPYRRRSCRECWAAFTAERTAKERADDEKRARSDHSPYGIARREVEALAGRLYNPVGSKHIPILTADWFDRGILHMHDVQYDRMVAIHDSAATSRSRS